MYSGSLETRLCFHCVITECYLCFAGSGIKPYKQNPFSHQWFTNGLLNSLCFSYKTKKKTSRCTCDVSKTDVSGFLPACNDHHFARVTVKNLCCACVPYLHKHDIILNNSNNTKNRNNVRYSTAHSFF